MGITTIKKNSINLLKTYLPNLFIYLTESDIELFVDKSILYTNKLNFTELKGSFLASFFLLLREHKENQQSITRKEFGYMNHLIGKFAQVNPKSKHFIDLLKATIYNFEEHSFLNAMGEIAACLTIMDYPCIFSKYEETLSNGKSVDFKFVREKDKTPIVY